MAYPFDEQENGSRLRANATDYSETQRRLGTTPNAGEALRANTVDYSEAKRLASPPATIADTAKAAPRNVPLGTVTPNAAPYNPSAPVVNPNVASGTPSAEAAEYLKSRAAPQSAPATIAEAAKPTSMYGRAAAAASESARAAMPPGSGAIAKIAAGAPSVLGTVAKKVLPGVAPAIEGFNVAKVALDPNSSKLDVATQAAEGVTRTASTIAGAGLGGALGTAVAPGPGTIIGGIAGGAAGYFAGDAGIKALRGALGLSTESPVDRIQPPAPPTPQITPPAPPATIAAAAQQGIPPAVNQPSTNRQQVNGGRQPVNAAIAAPPQGAPAIGEGSVEIIRPGGIRTVAIPTAGGYVEVPHEQFTTGNGQGFIESVAKGQTSAADPVTAKMQVDLSKTEAEGKNQANVAGIQSVSAGNVAGINKQSAQKVAEIGAESGKKNLILIPGEETLSPDGFTKLKGPSRLYDSSTKQYVDEPPAPPKAKPSKEVAISQAKKALSAGAAKDAINARLQSYGYDPIK